MSAFETEFERYLELIGDGLAGLAAWETDVRVATNEKAGARACVVINANPFTNGHRYLVEVAAQRCEELLVFVTQGRPESGGQGNHENTGIVFSFQDRKEMTIKGLEGLKNVKILPSGPYLISRDDFPAGFLSERMGTVSAHAILDSMVFCHVCKSIGATLAFAGDEPRDELSEIHLNALRRQCLEERIVLRVVERKRLGEKYISSALVRQAMQDKDWEMVKSLVPKGVLEIMRFSGFRVANQ